MITVAEARATAAKRLRTRAGEWAGRLVAEGTVTDGFSLGLKPPTEAQALADRAAAQEWVRSWRDADGVRGCAVDWERRAWPRIGAQTVPVRVRAADPGALADFADGQDGAAWRTLAARAVAVRERFTAGGRGGGDAGSSGDRGLGDDLAVVVRKHRAAITALDDAAFGQVLGAAEWLAEHRLERMRPRQLPLRGVDSKWFARHRTLVSDLYAVLTGGRSLDILDPEDRVRIRILGADCVGEAERPGVRPPGERGVDASGSIGGRDGSGSPGGSAVLAGLTDLAAPVEQIAALPLRPRIVIVSENLESMLALPPWDGVVATHGSGYAVSVIEHIDWLRDAPVLYWGDLDSHGFAILHRLRTHLPEVTSVLMDEETLVAHRDLWVTEEKPRRGEFDTLTGHEKRALARVRDEGDVRLEQERIPWDVALTALRDAVTRVDVAEG